MKRLMFLALGVLTLTGCTGSRIKPPAVCDGKHRRPANVYGSILPMLPLPLPPSQSEGRSMAPPQTPDTGLGSVFPAVVPPDLPLDPSSAPESRTKGDADPVPTGMTTLPSASRTFRRDISLSYLSC